MSGWIAVGIYTLFLYATLPFGRSMLNLIKGSLGSYFGLFINLLLVGLGFALFASFRRRAMPSLRGRLLLVLSGVILAFTVSQIELAEERFHLLQYAGLGYLASRAVRPLRGSDRQGGPAGRSDPLLLTDDRPALLERLGLSGSVLLEGKGMAVGIVFVIGVGDELIQWLLPNRIFDLRDILFNILGGITGILLQAGTHSKPLST